MSSAYPPYGQQPQQQTSPLAIVSLVLGIIGICCGQLFLLSIGAIVTGAISRSQIAASGGQQKGGGLALAGLILGVIGILIGIAYWVLFASGAIDTRFTVTR